MGSFKAVWEKVKKFALIVTIKFSLFLSIVFLFLACIFLVSTGASVLLLHGAFTGNKIAIVMGFVLVGLITTILPTSLVSLLLPEATISKVAGLLGVGTSIASVIVLFTICLFLSSFGVLIFGFLGLFFLTIVLCLRKYSEIKKSFLIIIAAILCVILGLWLIVSIISLGILQVNVVIAVLALLFIIYALMLLRPYFEKKADKVIQKNSNQNKMFCKYCGEEIDKNSKYCKKCGKNLKKK